MEFITLNIRGSVRKMGDLDLSAFTSLGKKGKS